MAKGHVRCDPGSTLNKVIILIKQQQLLFQMKSNTL
jgi:hypothetical protein